MRKTITHKSTENTKVQHEEQITFNAPHFFTVTDKNDNFIVDIDFQYGPVKEKGVNGVTNEDLLNIVRLRLEAFQNSEFKCVENNIAIQSIKTALYALEHRTTKRTSRGVEGTYVV